MTRCWMLLAALCVTQAQAVNRCTRPGGEVVFQDAPCASADQTQRLQVKPAAGHATAQDVATRDRQQLVNTSYLRGEPFVGMTVMELQRAMGLPSKVNSANYGRGQEDQRIYYRTDSTWYVYTAEGAVRSIQRTDGPDPSIVRRPEPPPRVCPSAKEIWDLEVKASSIDVRGNDLLQRDLINRLADMRACR